MKDDILVPRWSDITKAWAHPYLDRHGSSDMNGRPFLSSYLVSQPWMPKSPESGSTLWYLRLKEKARYFVMWLTRESETRSTKSSGRDVPRAMMIGMAIGADLKPRQDRQFARCGWFDAGKTKPLGIKNLVVTSHWSTLIRQSIYNPVLLSWLHRHGLTPLLHNTAQLHQVAGYRESRI